ncbi:MAG: amidohydrolase family protein [Ardenticatenaceae bacterium]|nr:amidohydrolase family protein [Ardenticatenaceae bacterium]
MLIDAHVHIWEEDGPDDEWARQSNAAQMRYATRHDVRLCAFVTGGRLQPGVEELPTVAEFATANRFLARYRDRFPDRILPFAYVNPAYPNEAIRELERCVKADGFVGLKLLRSVRCSDPRVALLAREAGKLGVPLLQHAGTGPDVIRPGESTTEDLIELAQRVPETNYIFAHVSGGGEWEWEIKALKPYPNIYLDTSGSVREMGITEMMVREVGAPRILFGTDGSNCAALGRLFGAEISEEERRLIGYANMARLLHLDPAGDTGGPS